MGSALECWEAGPLYPWRLLATPRAYSSLTFSQVSNRNPRAFSAKLLSGMSAPSIVLMLLFLPKRQTLYFSPWSVWGHWTASAHFYSWSRSPWVAVGLSGTSATLWGFHNTEGHRDLVCKRFLFITDHHKSPPASSLINKTNMDRKIMRYYGYYQKAFTYVTRTKDIALINRSSN